MKVTRVLLFVLLAAVPAAAQAPNSVERAAAARAKGAPSATVTVYEIADFQCPFCARFSREVFPRIDSAYVKTGKAKWVFVNFPLPNHAHAWAAAESAMCAAGVDNKFWPVHDQLFAAQSEWTGATNAAAVFAGYAKTLGVPAAEYDACVADDRMAVLLVRDILNATGAGITGTPAFVVNNEPIFAGLRTFDEWQEILDAAIKKAAAPAK
ncbi:MAG: DsbA family protein [Gemmatimonadota bacterium]